MSTRAECEVTADTAPDCSVTFGELLGEMTMTYLINNNYYNYYIRNLCDTVLGIFCTLYVLI